MARRNDNEYVDMKNDKLTEQHDKVLDMLLKALKETSNNPDDLLQLLEMERELTLREEI